MTALNVCFTGLHRGGKAELRPQVSWICNRALITKDAKGSTRTHRRGYPSQILSKMLPGHYNRRRERPFGNESFPGGADLLEFQHSKPGIDRGSTSRACPCSQINAKGGQVGGHMWVLAILICTPKNPLFAGSIVVGEAIDVPMCLRTNERTGFHQCVPRKVRANPFSCFRVG